MMSVTEAIQSQKTVRGFMDKPVPQDLIREVIDLARLAPSNGNSQPWHIAVVSGEARDAIEADILARVEHGEKPNPVFPPGGVGLKGRYKQRQYACADRYYGSMSIERHETEKRQELLLKNWQFFGAPHGAFISMPATMHRANALDLGIFLQTLMLLFGERGISCCPQGALAAFPDVVKQYVRIPEENAILVGLSFGYEDIGAQINSAKMDREPLETVATFVEKIHDDHQPS